MLSIPHAVRSMCLYIDENIKTVNSHIFKWFSIIEVDPTTTFHSPLRLQIQYSQENPQHLFHLQNFHYKSAKCVPSLIICLRIHFLDWIKLVAKPKIMRVLRCLTRSSCLLDHFIVFVSLLVNYNTSVILTLLQMMKQVEIKHRLLQSLLENTVSARNCML